MSAGHSLQPLAMPFPIPLERLDPVTGSPMSGVGADIIKVFGIAFFQKGEVLYLFDILNKNIFLFSAEVGTYLLKRRDFYARVFP